MPDFVETLAAEAEAAMAEMRAAALRARALHARAELMRHMLTTARKVKDSPRAEAVDKIVGEWMAAWHLDRAAWPELARDIERFTEAFHDHARGATPETDAALKEKAEALDAALARHGTSIADQMAWRSQCAHGWWAWVAPVPADLPGAKPRPMVPEPRPGEAFWEAGCAPMCR